jgi:hypothetical protein
MPMDITVPVVENVLIIEFLCWVDYFSFRFIFTKSMEQRDLKNVNSYLNTNIYSHLETSGDQSSNLFLNVVHFFNTSVIRHLWQLKTCFAALVSNMCCSIQITALKNYLIIWTVLQFKFNIFLYHKKSNNWTIQIIAFFKFKSWTFTKLKPIWHFFL